MHPILVLVMSALIRLSLVSSSEGQRLRARPSSLQAPSLSDAQASTPRKLAVQDLPASFSAFDYVFALDEDMEYNGDCTAVRVDGVDGKFISDEICNERAGYFFSTEQVCTVGWTGSDESTIIEFLEYEISSDIFQIVDIVLRVAGQSTRRVKVEVFGASPFQERIFDFPGTGDWDIFTDITWNDVEVQDGTSRVRVSFLDGKVNLCSVSVSGVPTGCDLDRRVILQSGDTVFENQDNPKTTDDNYAFITQEDDGNLVIRRVSDEAVLCESGYSGDEAIEYGSKLQGDGNLLTYDNPELTKPEVVWKSDSVGPNESTYFLVVNCDDTVTINQDSVSGPVLWTCPSPPPPTTKMYEATHVFSIDDVMGGFDGSTFGANGSQQDSSIICGAPGSSSNECPDGMVDKDGTVLYPIDSEFGFNVLDFVGGQRLVRDWNYQEGFAGNIEGGGLKVSNVGTSTYKVKPPLGTWCQGLSSTSVKCSTEHYSVMEHVLSCHEALPYKFADPITGEQAVQSFPDGSVSFDCANAELDNDIKTISDGTVGDSYFPPPELTPNDNSDVLNDIAASRDYSITYKDDGKVLYRWGSLVKLPIDVRLYAKLKLPDEWKVPGNDFVIKSAKLIVTHQITNNPNDQVRPVRPSGCSV